MSRAETALGMGEGKGGDADRGRHGVEDSGVVPHGEQAGHPVHRNGVRRRRPQQALRRVAGHATRRRTEEKSERQTDEGERTRQAGERRVFRPVERAEREREGAICSHGHEGLGIIPAQPFLLARGRVQFLKVVEADAVAEDVGRRCTAGCATQKRLVRWCEGARAM